MTPDLSLVLDHIRRDAAKNRFADWGRSTILDEHTNAPVIDKRLFDLLHEAAGIAANFPVGNAGLLHVYGYWFSDVVTPFGYKRDRWVDGHLARALGRGPTEFHLENGQSTTLLERVVDAALPLLTATREDIDGGSSGGRVADALFEGLRTRVVLASAGTCSATALVYGIDGGTGMRLVTTFPFAGDTRQLLRDFVEHPRLRWNAIDAHAS